jgi:hypothetical protein
MTIKQLVLWICGLEMNESSLNQNQNEDQAEFIDISQSPREKIFCNIQAVILVCITAFVITFFNRFS